MAGKVLTYGALTKEQIEAAISDPDLVARLEKNYREAVEEMYRALEGGVA